MNFKKLFWNVPSGTVAYCGMPLLIKDKQARLRLRGVSRFSNLYFAQRSGLFEGFALLGSLAFFRIALRSDLLSHGKFWRLDVNFVDKNLFRQSIKIDINLNHFSFTELLGLSLETGQKKPIQNRSVGYVGFIRVAKAVHLLTWQAQKSKKHSIYKQL